MYSHPKPEQNISGCSDIRIRWQFTVTAVGVIIVHGLFSQIMGRMIIMLYVVMDNILDKWKQVVADDEYNEEMILHLLGAVLLIIIYVCTYVYSCYSLSYDY